MDLTVLLQLSILIPWFLSLLFGLVVGATPGLSATIAVSLLIPVAYSMPPVAGLAMVIGVSCTAIFSGDIPATYLRVPGTGASAAAVLDGYEMAQQGKSGLALALDLFCSSLGGVIGVLCLIFIAPYLATFALKFTHFQYFWLSIFGLIMSIFLSQSSPIKGAISLCLGLLLSTVGMDLSTGYYRFTFGSLNLADGIVLTPVIIGLLGMSEVINKVSQPQNLQSVSVFDTAPMPPLSTTFGIIWRLKLLVLRSALIGAFIGALPGAGADIAAWVTYGTAKKTSKEPEKFGHGAEEGVVAPTSANNAAICGAWIPALVFGIPGDSITAVVLGAMLVFGITPGPRIFTESSQMIRGVFSIAFLSQLILIPAGIIGIKAFLQILKMPPKIVFVLVGIFALTGSYAIRRSFFDIFVMLFMAGVGYMMRRLSIPQAPLILGLILGPMVENNLRVGLLKSGGDFRIFLFDPICAVLVTLIVLVVMWEPCGKLIHYLRARR
ncbi:MAG: tripartite tricarboxylate transporter permease [Pyramidobacter sp.]|nr:tripartite tricarboxylate transporter permease [Pyramidobacter sp.]MBP3752584.1 tripartite tricarboxylate transporter permease [Pyramidobacter sp.]